MRDRVKARLGNTREKGKGRGRRGEGWGGVGGESKGVIVKASLVSTVSHEHLYIISRSVT